MSADWTPLRVFLDEWVGDQIAAEPDRALRRAMERRRDRIVDAVELHLLRRMVAERSDAAERAPIVQPPGARTVLVNGRA